jgi:hypothetical protein
MMNAVELCASDPGQPVRRPFGLRLLGRLVGGTPARRSPARAERLTPYLLRDIGLSEFTAGADEGGRPFDWLAR